MKQIKIGIIVFSISALHLIVAHLSTVDKNIKFCKTQQTIECKNYLLSLNKK